MTKTVSYWQQGVDDATAGRPQALPLDRGYRNGYEYGTLCRDPALQAALDAFTQARARGTGIEMIRARGELLRLLGVVDDGGAFARLQAAIGKRRAASRARGDVADLRMLDSLQGMVDRAK